MLGLVWREWGCQEPAWESKDHKKVFPQNWEMSPDTGAFAPSVGALRRLTGGEGLTSSETTGDRCASSSSSIYRTACIGHCQVLSLWVGTDLGCSGVRGCQESRGRSAGLSWGKVSCRRLCDTAPRQEQVGWARRQRTQRHKSTPRALVLASSRSALSAMGFLI